MKNWIFLWGQRRIERGAWFFAPLSWIWGFISYLRNLIYDLQWCPISSLPCTVISVGNIVVGGTGKTPFVLLLAQTFSHRKVAILSRGYGPFTDEAALLLRRLPQVKIYIGKDRISSGKRAIAEGAELLILDDGFQYRKLQRDFNFVLLDGEDPLGKGHYLPWGYLRDSPKRLLSADAVFVKGRDLILTVKQILNLQEDRIASIQGERVALFSAIAKPSQFKKTVVGIGAEVVCEKIFADHALISIDLLEAFADEARQHGAAALLCTEKDFVKLPLGLVLSLPILFLEMELKFFGDKMVWEKLIAKIDQKIDNYGSL